MDRHVFDPISLFSGLLFAAFGSLLLAGQVDILTQAHWVVPLVLIAVAAALLATALLPLRAGAKGSAERPSP